MTDWDQRFIDLAVNVSNWSKDPSTKLGAIAVGKKREVLATGYNGFPRGIADSEERYNNREEKYKHVVHAEMNVIYNATYNGVSLDGATLYVYGLPICSECAKGIIQVGIRRVVISANTNKSTHPQWEESFKQSLKILAEAKIKVERI